MRYQGSTQRRKGEKIQTLDGELGHSDRRLVSADMGWERCLKTLFLATEEGQRSKGAFDRKHTSKRALRCLCLWNSPLYSIFASNRPVRSSSRSKSSRIIHLRRRPRAGAGRSEASRLLVMHCCTGASF